MQIICKVVTVFPSVEKTITGRMGSEELTIKPMVLKMGADTIYCEAFGQEARRLDKEQLDEETTYVASLRLDSTERKADDGRIFRNTRVTLVNLNEL